MAGTKTPYYYNLSEPIEIFDVDHSAHTLTEIALVWARIEPIRPGGERYVYQAEQRVLRGCYRVWMDQAHAVENQLIRWNDRYFEIVSAPVYDALSPWQYFIIEEVQDDLSDYDQI